jgi:hypothetical protein
MEENGEPRRPPVFDGMALPPFPPLRQDAKKRFEEIRNLECRKDDVILAIFPKSGILIVSVKGVFSEFVFVLLLLSACLRYLFELKSIRYTLKEK